MRNQHAYTGAKIDKLFHMNNGLKFCKTVLTKLKSKPVKTVHNSNAQIIMSAKTYKTLQTKLLPLFVLSNRQIVG